MFGSRLRLAILLGSTFFSRFPREVLFNLRGSGALAFRRGGVGGGGFRGGFRLREASLENLRLCGGDGFGASMRYPHRLRLGAIRFGGEFS